MNGDFSIFPKEFDSLEPIIREKALENARVLLSNESMTEEDAVVEAIAAAQQWFYELEDEI